MDASGNAYVTGYTQSSNFPTASAIYGSYAGGNGDAFVTKLNTSGSSLIYSTYLGGSNVDNGLGIAVDTSGNTYVTGNTQSSNFPTASATYGSYVKGRDAFITKILANTISTTLVTYEYDKLSRLTQIAYGGNGTVTYTYDAVGNRKSVTITATTPSATPTAPPTATPTAKPTPGATGTPASGVTPTPKASPTPTASPKPTMAASPTPTPKPSPTPMATASPTPSCPGDGDVNEDGKLTAKDALLAFECALGKATCTSCQQGHADVNGNGRVTAADALCIFKAVLNGSSPSETLSCE